MPDKKNIYNVAVRGAETLKHLISCSQKTVEAIELLKSQLLFFIFIFFHGRIKLPRKLFHFTDLNKTVQLSDRDIFCWADLPFHFKANTRGHPISSACCATLSPFINGLFLVQCFCFEFICIEFNTKYAFGCVCLCCQGHKQGPRTEAGCWNVDHISQTYWKYCVDLLCFLHCLWHSGSSGTHMLLHYLKKKNLNLVHFNW